MWVPTAALHLMSSLLLLLLLPLVAQRSASGSSFQQVETGQCDDVPDRWMIKDIDDCERAAAALGWPDDEANSITPVHSVQAQPPGCFGTAGGTVNLYLNSYNNFDNDATPCGLSNMDCICWLGERCTETDGLQPNDEDCMCGTKICDVDSGGEAYCDKAANLCTTTSQLGSPFRIISTLNAGMAAAKHYRGAVAVGGRVYFGGSGHSNIGVLDTSDKTFSTIPTGSSNFLHSALVPEGTDIYFSPWNSHHIGVVNTVDNSFATIATPGSGADVCKFATVLITNGKAYFTPRHSNVVGVVDTRDKTFSTIQTGLTGNHKYADSVLVGNRIFFTPSYTDNVGVLDLSDNSFSTIDTTAAGVTEDTKYASGTVVGSRIFFTPVHEDNVGVVNTLADTFSTITTSGVSGDYKYASAVTVGTKIYFSPQNADNIGVLDTSDDTFSKIPTAGVTGQSKYFDSVVFGKRIFFTPYQQDNFGVLDTTDKAFSTISTRFVDDDYKYMESVLVNRKIYVAPGLSDTVGVLTVACAENERVYNNSCIACPNGMTNPAGDDVIAGIETFCTYDEYLIEASKDQSKSDPCYSTKSEVQACMSEHLQARHLGTSGVLQVNFTVSCVHCDSRLKVRSLRVEATNAKPSEYNINGITVTSVISDANIYLLKSYMALSSPLFHGLAMSWRGQMPSKLCFEMPIDEDDSAASSLGSSSQLVTDAPRRVWVRVVLYTTLKSTLVGITTSTWAEVAHMHPRPAPPASFFLDYQGTGINVTLHWTFGLTSNSENLGGWRIEASNDFFRNRSVSPSQLGRRWYVLHDFTPSSGSSQQTLEERFGSRSTFARSDLGPFGAHIRMRFKSDSGVLGWSKLMREPVCPSASTAPLSVPSDEGGDCVDANSCKALRGMKLTTAWTRCALCSPVAEDAVCEVCSDWRLNKILHNTCNPCTDGKRRVLVGSNVLPFHPRGTPHDSSADPECNLFSNCLPHECGSTTASLPPFTPSKTQCDPLAHACTEVHSTMDRWTTSGNGQAVIGSDGTITMTDRGASTNQGIAWTDTLPLSGADHACFNLKVKSQDYAAFGWTGKTDILSYIQAEGDNAVFTSWLDSDPETSWWVQGMPSFVRFHDKAGDASAVRDPDPPRVNSAQCTDLPSDGPQTFKGGSIGAAGVSRCCPENWETYGDGSTCRPAGGGDFCYLYGNDLGGDCPHPCPTTAWHANVAWWECNPQIPLNIDGESISFCREAEWNAETSQKEGVFRVYTVGGDGKKTLRWEGAGRQRPLDQNIRPFIYSADSWSEEYTNVSLVYSILS